MGSLLINLILLFVFDFTFPKTWSHQTSFFAGKEITRAIYFSVFQVHFCPKTELYYPASPHFSQTNPH